MGEVTLRRIGIVVHRGKPRAVETAGVLQSWGTRRGTEVVELDVWGADATRRHAREELAAAGDIELVVTVGGDGTFLRGLRVAAAADLPVLGIDVGRVGFLTEVEADRAVETVEAFEAGTAVIERRLTLTVRSSRPLEVPDAFLHGGRGPALPPPAVRPSNPQDVGWGMALDVTALNDVVFEKAARDRQASLAVYIDGRRFVSYSADALVVATPTGSTAYSFAAGGPVVSPRTEALVFTPVAAHMTFDRSLVLAADEPVAVRVLERSGQVVVSVDGQTRGVLGPGDWVGVHARPWRARLVRLGEPDFFDRVRTRFRVADAAAAVADGDAPPTYRPDLPVPPDMAHLYLPRADRGRD
jgi:NAD+ kinase